MPVATRSRTAANRSRAVRRPAAVPGGYWEQSQLPLTSLLFVLPLLALHEIGIFWFGRVAGGMVEYRVAAFTLLTRLFDSCGASGRYLPALAVVGVLLAWHVAKGDRWVFNTPLLPLMVLESLLLALPLVGVYFLFSPGGLTYLGGGDWKLLAALYLGAGVYEELVFRLGAFALLSMVLMDLLKCPRRMATPLIVLLAAATFSAYHMLGLGRLPWQAFVFVALRGVFYGTIFIERGFGITVGVHTAYDIFFLLLRELNG
jgi:hypothetical protein